jgi:hypothetical protein
MHFFGFPEEIRDAMTKRLRVIQKELIEVEGRTRALHQENAQKVLDAANKDAYGNTIDEDFNSKEILDKTEEDVGWWRLNLGNYKFANSGIIRMAHKVIAQTYDKVKMFTIKVANDLLAAQELMEKSGVKVEDLVEKDENGNPTQYLIRQYAWGEYYKSLNKVKGEIAKTLGFETFREIDTATLNKSQLKIYRDTFKKFNSIY